MILKVGDWNFACFPSTTGDDFDSDTIHGARVFPSLPKAVKRIVEESLRLADALQLGAATKVVYKVPSGTEAEPLGGGLPAHGCSLPLASQNTELVDPKKTHQPQFCVALGGGVRFWV